MKKIEKHYVKVDFKNALLEILDGRLVIVEYDKHDDVIEETDFLDCIEDLIGQKGITITVKRENDIEE